MTEVVEAELTGLTGVQRGLLRDLQAARDRLAVRRFALMATVADVNEARTQLEGILTAERQARARVEATRAERQGAKAEITALAAASYRKGADSWAIGAIGTVDVASAGGLTRARIYARADALVLDARLDELAAIERRLEGEREAAENVRVVAERAAADLDARLLDQQRAHDDAAEEADTAQAEVVRSLGADLALVAQMTRPQFGGDRISATLAFLQAGQTPPASLEGRFAVPVVPASLSSYFGVRIDPFRGNVGFHAGLDFAAPSGTPIRTPAAGIVIIAEECGGYGSCVVVDHGSALATLYGHLSEIGARVGDVVTAGQVIGLVGSTGRSTGPHLHFEVRVGGTPIDPLPTLFG